MLYFSVSFAVVVLSYACYSTLRLHFVAVGSIYLNFVLYALRMLSLGVGILAGDDG